MWMPSLGVFCMVFWSGPAYNAIVVHRTFIGYDALPPRGKRGFQSRRRQRHFHNDFSRGMGAFVLSSRIARRSIVLHVSAACPSSDLSSLWLARARLSRQAAFLPSSHLASVLGWLWFFPRFSIFFIVGCPAQSRWRRSPRSKLVSRVVSGQVVVIFMPCSKNNDEAPPPKKFSMQ